MLTLGFQECHSSMTYFSDFSFTMSHFQQCPLEIGERGGGGGGGGVGVGVLAVSPS